MQTGLMPLERVDFADADTLAAELAALIAASLRAHVGERGRASLAVSGGSTPARLFHKLSAADIDWAQVQVTLVDERWVDEVSPRSNAGLVRRTLLIGRAEAATFVPLYSQGHDPDAGAGMAEARIAEMAQPFAAVILGMGEDGHTASWFPDGDRLADATDPGCPQRILVMQAPSAGQPRVTLTLPAVLESQFIALHIEGEAKRSVLARALEPGPIAELPVRAVLRQERVPVKVFWAP